MTREEIQEHLADTDPDFTALEEAVRILEFMGKDWLAMRVCDVLDEFVEREGRRNEDRACPVHREQPALW